MSFSLISTAYAATATAPAAGNAEGFSSILLLVGFVLIFYFILWRPQSKRAKEQRDLINSLTKGDEVITAGGVLGKITKLADNYISLEIADGIEITIQKGSITGSLPKGTLKSL